jgi:hypothetical protein
MRARPPPRLLEPTKLLAGEESVRKVAAGLLIVLIVQCLFTLSLVGALHNPVPHDLPFGVTGPSPLVTQVESQLSLKTIQYPNESAVREAIDQGKIYGALLPGSGSDTLIVVPAASFIIQTYVEPAFLGAAQKLHTPLTVQQSHPLPASDRVGAVAGLLLLPLLIGGYLASVLITKATGAASASALAPLPLTVNFERAAKQQRRTLEVEASNKPPAGDPFATVPSLILIPLLIGGYVASTMLMTATGAATGRWRVAILVGFALVAALLVDLISGAFVWGWPIHQFWILWPIMALVIAAVALVASVLQKLVGAAGTLLTIIVMIQFGNPSSGGANGVPFLPAFWRNIGPFLPPRQALTAIHNTMYFDGHGTTQALVVVGV